jgi:ubiquitin carboxyl-terminal hydrolase 10
MNFGDNTTSMMVSILPPPTPPAHLSEQDTKPDDRFKPVPEIIKPKPSSWAALFGKPGSKVSAPVDTLSAGPSSIRASPSKSNRSLDTDAISDVETVTPRSSAVALPPPSAGSTTSTSRPVINYAAAAAASKHLSPQEDLIKLLTEGLRGRPRDPLPNNIPRGLINTGNMCFANTVSSHIPDFTASADEQILQVLVYCSPFAELLEEFSKRLVADLARRTPLLEAM